MATGTEAPQKLGVKRWLTRYGRWCLLVVGLVCIGFLVNKVGPERVGKVLLDAGPWIPVVVLLEASWVIGGDIVALRALAAEKKSAIPMGELVRASALSYAVTILAPAGRAAGEVARATVLSKYLGPGRAASTAAHMHAASLLANGTACIVAAIAVVYASGVHSTLSLLVLANVALVGTLGSLLLLLGRNAKVGAWLARKAARFNIHVKPRAETAAHPIPPAAAGKAVLAMWSGRCIQALMYGVVLAAVGGGVTLVSTFVAHAIHLVGANLGDVVPGQMGVTETAYSAFSNYIGLGDEPARALSIPLVVRIAQITVAIVCMIVFSTRRLRTAEELAERSQKQASGAEDAAGTTSP